MPEQVTVSADDVRVVVGALAGLAQFPYLAAIGGLGPAQEAAARLLAAADMAGLPADPVPGPDQAAIGLHEMMCAYERAGFSREEAFAVMMAITQASAMGFALRGGPHG